MTRKEIDMLKHMLDKLFKSIAEGDEPKTVMPLNVAYNSPLEILYSGYTDFKEVRIQVGEESKNSNDLSDYTLLQQTWSEDKIYIHKVYGKAKKTELELMKELYATGDYVCYFKAYEEWQEIPTPTFSHDVSRYKIIKKGEHEKVAEAVANDSSVVVEYFHSGGYRDLSKNFFEAYKSHSSYRLKEPKPNFNGGWIEASREAFDLLVESGCEKSFEWEDLEVLDALVIKDNEIIDGMKLFGKDKADYKQFYINNGQLSWGEPEKIDFEKAHKDYIEETISISDGEKLYEFEKPDFECRLYDVIGDVIAGSFDDDEYGRTINQWSLDGTSHDGSYSNLTPVQPTAEETKSTWWIPEDEYYFVATDGTTFSSDKTKMFGATTRLGFGNCYKTKEQAELASKAMRKHNSLLKWVIDYQGDLEGFHIIHYSVGKWESRESYAIHGDTITMKKETAEALCKALNSNEFCLDSEV